MSSQRNRSKVGARPYKNYSEETLLLAIDLVKNKMMSSYEAEKKFLIPRRTIEKRVKNLHSDKPGPQKRLSQDEELKFIKVLNTSSECGYPFTQLDLRLLVFEYLVKNNRAGLFENKPPGDWWVKAFIERHSDELTLRATQNIKKGRTKKLLADFQSFHKNLKVSIEGVPPSNILNYDEKNLSDDPGASECVLRRDVKYPERMSNYSMACVSIMFAGVANGSVLPPYVVYKGEGESIHSNEGGPEEARYNTTKTGWFDSTTFLDWFMTILIPWAKRLQGPKLIIGDSLSSHINIDVLDLCEEHNIRFVFLPPPPTHLIQPLDVAFFYPLNNSWRKILTKYKADNPNETSLNKNHFPVLLKRLLEDAEYKHANVMSGFRATGICPYNSQEVYKRVPECKVSKQAFIGHQIP